MSYQSIQRSIDKLLNVCCECGEDWNSDSDQYSCPACGCEDYDTMSADDLQEKRTGGLDADVLSPPRY